MVLGRVETIDELKRGKAALTKVSCNAWATRQRPLRHSWRREEDSDPYLSGLIPQRMQPDDDSFPKRIFNGTNSSLYKGISTRSINTRRLPIFIETRNDRNCRADYWRPFEDRSIDRDPRSKRELLGHPPPHSRSCFALCIPPSPSLSLSSIDPTTLLSPRRRLRHNLLSIVAKVGHGLICRTLNLVVA